MMQSKPWYRERWPWILISGPATVLVAGAATMWIAFASADGVVAGDYYKRGLAINQDLQREKRAEQSAIGADVTLPAGRIRVRLSGAAPEALFGHLVHATRAGHDQRVRLAKVAPGLYETEMPALPAGRWRIVLEDPRREWRLVREAL
jgi:uncharacterized protein